MKTEKKKEYDYYENILNISIKFNRCITQFIKTAENKRPNDVNINQIRNLVTLSKCADETSIIEECYQNIWEYRNEIKKRNLKVFDDYNLIAYTQKKEYKNNVYSGLIFNLTKIISDGVKILKQNELLFLWKLADEMVMCVAEYKALKEHGLDFYLQFKKKINDNNSISN